MADTVDELQIKINAEATKANDAIDRLVGKLDRLTTSLSRVNGTNLNGLANGVQRLGNAMQVMNTIKTADFTRLATNLTRLGSVNVSALNSAASSMSHLTRAMSALSGTSFDNKNVQNLINSITRLSNANVGSLASVDFSRLGISVNQLATSLSNAPKIQQSVISMTNAIANLAKSGQNIPIVASSLGNLGQSMNAFMASVSSAPNVSENVISFAQAVGLLANSGAKAGITAKNLSSLGVGLNNLMTTLSRSPQVSQNVIQMTNALANLASQGSKVGSASNSIVRGLNKTSSSAKTARKSFGGLASAIGKFYATYFMVIRSLKGLWSSIKSTADYIEAYNYFNVALGKIGSDWSHQFEKYGYENAESYAESFKTRLSESLGKLSGLQVTLGADGKGLLTESGMKNLGLNIQEITQYASQLASVTNSVGQTGEVSLAVASSFTKLAGDISSLFNVDYSAVSKNLQSGLIGQSRALYKYGIDITNATLQTYAYELGLSKAVSEMTQAEKMQLRMIAILDQSKVAWGDLANTINSPSNMIRQLTNNLKETGMVLGQLFIPLMQRVLPVINGVTIAIKRLLVNIAGLLGVEIDLDAFGKGYQAIEDTEDYADDAADSYDNAAKKAEEWKNQLLGFDEINRLNDQDTSDSNTGTDTPTSTFDLTDEITKAADEYEKVWQAAYDKMDNEAQAWADKIYDVITNQKWYEVGSSIGSLLSDGIKSIDFGELGKWVTDTICGALDFVTGFVDSVDWEEFGKKVVEFIENVDLGEIAFNITKLVISIAKGAVKFVWGEFQAIYEKHGLAGVIFTVIANGALPGGPLIVKFVTEFWAEVSDSQFFKNIKDWWNNTGLPGIKNFFKKIPGVNIAIGITNFFINNAIELWNDFKENWENLSDNKVGIFNILSVTAKTLWDNFSKAWKNLPDVVVSINNVLANTAQKLWQWFKDQWANLFGVNVSIDNKFKNPANALWENFKKAWQDLTAVNVFIGNSLINTAQTLWSKFKAGWNNLPYSSVSIANTLRNSATTLRNWFKNDWDKINPFVSIGNGLAKTAKALWETFKASWESLNPIVWFKIGGRSSGGGGGASFATGGFPEDGLFFANHNELVGQFSNGKTAVANNEQITEGIKWAAYEGMSMALSQYGGGSTSVNVVLEGDADGLFKTVQGKANNYTRQTGKPAFIV